MALHRQQDAARRGFRSEREGNARIPIPCIPCFSLWGEQGGLPRTGPGHESSHGVHTASSSFCGSCLRRRAGDVRANLVAAPFRKAQELQAAGLSLRIRPGHFAPGLDAFPQIQRKPEMNWAVFLDGSKGFKTQTSLGNVQDRSTVILLQLQESKLVRYRPRFFAAFQSYVSQCHVFSEACLFSERPSTAVGGRGVEFVGLGGGRRRGPPAHLRPYSLSWRGWNR